MKGYVYFFRQLESPYVKIGYTNNESVSMRFAAFKMYSPLGATIDAVIESSNAKLLESELHVRYAAKRVSGEFFQMTSDEVEAIRRANEGSDERDLRNVIEVFISSGSCDDMKRLKNMILKVAPTYDNTQKLKIEVLVHDVVNKRFIGTRFTATEVQNFLADTIDDIEDLPSLKQIGEVLKLTYKIKSYKVNGQSRKMYSVE
jgi:hypothetical protein